MSLYASMLAASIAMLAVSDLANPRAESWDRDQALQELRGMIAPSPEARRDYALALEIWQRENGTGAVPPREAPGR